MIMIKIMIRNCRTYSWMILSSGRS